MVRLMLRTGIATQDPELRKRFTGTPEHIINFFTFVAEEVREIMAELGFRTFNEMIGRMDRLDTRPAIDHWKAKGLDFSRIFAKPDVGPEVAIFNCEKQKHGLEKALDNDLIEKARPALEDQTPVRIQIPVRNINRTVGAMLSGQIARRYGHQGLPDDTIHVSMKGNAGQSFGAWLAHGVTLELEGDANDYVGKGLSGGRLIISKPAESPIKPEENIIIGNTVLYGAIAGECYFQGVAGERFAVRNSGAIAVVEALPDDTIHVSMKGNAGQSFGAWLAHGVTLELEGDANDYVGKGLSGGRLIISKPAESPIKPEENIIIGNTVLYGAIAGECYFQGVAGERFAVRNSGAIAVVEGVGDHGCEYMTGGCVIVLGGIGRNFAAGMSGGVAYVLDQGGNFEIRCNLAMVEIEEIAKEVGDYDADQDMADVMADMTSGDERRLRFLIERHMKFTGSSRAKEILNKWQAMLPKFVKVMPVDYRRALTEQKAQEEQGLVTLAAGE